MDDALIHKSRKLDSVVVSQLGLSGSLNLNVEHAHHYLSRQGCVSVHMYVYSMQPAYTSSKDTLE